MPAYVAAATNLKPQGYVGRGATVWAAEASGTITASTQLSVHRDPHAPACLSVEIQFSVNPGVFQIDLQTADTDAEINYVTKASLTTGLNASFVGRIEITNLVATFVRLKKVTVTNACNVTAKIS